MKKFKEKLSFGFLLRNKPINKNLISVFKKAYRKNIKFFRKQPNKFKIIICDTKKELKENTKIFHKWSTASVEGNKLITRSPQWVEEIKKFTKGEYGKIMTHEISHIFWNKIYKTRKPIWLYEGLACYIGENDIYTKKELKRLIQKYNIKNTRYLEYRFLRRNYKKGSMPRYPLWANFTRYIIKRYSVNRLIRLIDKYTKNPSRTNYNTFFNNIFGKSEKQLFNEFLNKVNHRNSKPKINI